jgi:hypothetical protein
MKVSIIFLKNMISIRQQDGCCLEMYMYNLHKPSFMIIWTTFTVCATSLIVLQGWVLKHCLWLYCNMRWVEALRCKVL